MEARGNQGNQGKPVETRGNQRENQGKPGETNENQWKLGERVFKFVWKGIEFLPQCQFYNT